MCPAFPETLWGLANGPRPSAGRLPSRPLPAPQPRRVGAPGPGPSLWDPLTHGPPTQVQTTTMCVSVSLSGSVVLGCLFAPKLHIILFQPQKNVVSHRAPTSRFGSTAARAGPSHGQGQPPPRPPLRLCPPRPLLSMGATPWAAAATPPPGTGEGGGAGGGPPWMEDWGVSPHLQLPLPRVCLAVRPHRLQRSRGGGLHNIVALRTPHPRLARHSCSPDMDGADVTSDRSGRKLAGALQ